MDLFAVISDGLMFCKLYMCVCVCGGGGIHDIYLCIYTYDYRPFYSIGR